MCELEGLGLKLYRQRNRGTEGMKINKISETEAKRKEKRAIQAASVCVYFDCVRRELDWIEATGSRSTAIFFFSISYVDKGRSMRPRDILMTVSWKSRSTFPCNRCTKSSARRLRRFCRCSLFSYWLWVIEICNSFPVSRKCEALPIPKDGRHVVLTLPSSIPMKLLSMLRYYR